MTPSLLRGKFGPKNPVSELTVYVIVTVTVAPAMHAAGEIEILPALIAGLTDGADVMMELRASAGSF
jgi:hypothetical protein